MKWFDTYRRYANPLHAPDWDISAHRPAWPDRPNLKLQFQQFIPSLVSELDRLVHEEVTVMVKEVFPEEDMLAAFEDMASASAAWRDQQPIILADFQQAKNKPEATLTDVRSDQRRRMEEIMTGRKRRGPTKRDPRDRDAEPAALAAYDMWKIRKVIFPRFWPEEEISDWRLDMKLHGSVMAIAEIAASRHPECSASQAHSWYENNKLAGI